MGDGQSVHLGNLIPTVLAKEEDFFVAVIVTLLNLKNYFIF